MDFLDGTGKVFFQLFSKSTDVYLFAYNGLKDTVQVSQNTVDDFSLPGVRFEKPLEVWKKLIHPEDVKEFVGIAAQIMNGKTDNPHLIFRVKKRNGSYIRVRFRGHINRDEQGRVIWFCGISVEMTNKNKLDYITQSRSIYEFREELETFMKTEYFDGGILLLGIDDFTKINAMYSYSFGNQVLYRMAELLKDICPPNSSLYRIEGDKFAFLCPHFTKEELSQLFSEVKFRSKKVKITEDTILSISMSAGALMLQDFYGTVDDILKDLESALSISKQEVDGTLTFFSKKILDDAMEEIHLREELRRCVENRCEGFELYYQPIMDGSGEKLYSCEALLRWHSDKFPNISPARFIPALEDTGLIVEVGSWVGQEAALQLLAWRRYLPDLLMNINVSYIQIKSPLLMQSITKGLAYINLPMDSIVLEITESCEITDVDTVVSFVNSVRDQGGQLALDDFGTGYSSIRILQHVPSDWIKLDHNFVTQITDSEFDRNIVKYLMDLCHSLHFKVCVEGVETKTCFDLVKNLGADAIQGYYFSKPIPAAEFFAKYIENH